MRQDSFQLKYVIFLWWAHLFGKFGRQRGGSIRLIVLSITGGRKPTSGGRTTQTILFRINFDQQSKRARPSDGHNHNHDHDPDHHHDQKTNVSCYEIVEFWVIQHLVQHFVKAEPKVTQCVTMVPWMGRFMRGPILAVAASWLMEALNGKTNAEAESGAGQTG